MNEDWVSPIEMSISLLSKKWVIEIILLLMNGRKRFSDFQETIPNISGKVLSERLKELHKDGIIEKIILNVIPLKIKYQLTDRGQLLNRILFELSILGSSLYPDKISSSIDLTKEELIKKYGSYFDIDLDELNLRINNIEE